MVWVSVVGPGPTVRSGLVFGGGESTPGSAHHAAGGVVGPQGLSPEAAAQVTSRAMCGRRALDSGFGCLCSGCGCGYTALRERRYVE